MASALVVRTLSTFKSSECVFSVSPVRSVQSVSWNFFAVRQDRRRVDAQQFLRFVGQLNLFPIAGDQFVGGQLIET